MNRITIQEEEVLKDIVSSIYPSIQIEYSTDGPIINGEFNKVKGSSEKLNPFNHHYEVKPVGKSEWYSIEEKSEMFIRMMEIYREKINKDLCVFPMNFSESRNIIGGSDSEETCILITENGQEKIIYKKRRVSW